jgi:uncharacterized protein (TIGR03437 family)
MCHLRIDYPNLAHLRASVSSSADAVKVPSLVRSRGNPPGTRFLVSTDPTAGLQNVVLSATIGSHTFEQSLTVLPSDSPRVSAPRELSVKSGAPVRFQVTAMDTGRLPLAVSASPLPGSATFDPSTGSFEWLPATADLGSHEIAFTATGATGQPMHKTVKVDVGTGVPVVTALRNGASASAPAACSPGSAATLEGYFLSTSDEPVSDPSGASTSLGGASVLVNGQYARMLKTSSRRVSFLCPALPASSALHISVENAAGVSATIDTAVEETAPGIFGIEGPNGEQAVAVLAASGELAAVTNHRFAGNPALPGDTLAVQATGFDCSNASLPQLQIGPEYARILSVEPSANAGVCIIEAVVPSGISGDNVPMTLQTARSDASPVRSNTAFIAVDLRN